MTATAEKTTVQTFGVEIDHPRNADVLLQGIPGRKRLRSALNAGKPGYGEDAGIPEAQISRLRGIPPIPGMEIHVNPAKLVYTVIDPLHDNDDLCERIERGLKSNGRISSAQKVKGHEPQKGVLSVHWMKTLCRELKFLVECDPPMAKMVKGPKPDAEDIEGLPGNFLANPGSSIGQENRPMFEKDMDAWIAGL